MLPHYLLTFGNVNLNFFFLTKNIFTYLNLLKLKKNININLFKILKKKIFIEKKFQRFFYKNFFFFVNFTKKKKKIKSIIKRKNFNFILNLFLFLFKNNFPLLGVFKKKLFFFNNNSFNFFFKNDFKFTKKKKKKEFRNVLTKDYFLLKKKLINSFFFLNKNTLDYDFFFFNYYQYLLLNKINQNFFLNYLIKNFYFINKTEYFKNFIKKKNFYYLDFLINLENLYSNVFFLIKKKKLIKIKYFNHSLINLFDKKNKKNLKQRKNKKFYFFFRNKISNVSHISFSLKKKTKQIKFFLNLLILKKIKIKKLNNNKFLMNFFFLNFFKIEWKNFNKINKTLIKLIKKNRFYLFTFTKLNYSIKKIFFKNKKLIYFFFNKNIKKHFSVFFLLNKNIKLINNKILFNKINKKPISNIYFVQLQKTKKLFLINNFFFFILNTLSYKFTTVRLNKIKFFSKYNLSFKTKTNGFFFIEFFNFFNNNYNSIFFSFFKKNIFSFLNKNELHRHILKKYLKNFFFINSNTNETENKNHHLFNFFNIFNVSNYNKKLNLISYFINKSAPNKNWSLINETIKFSKTFDDPNYNISIKKIKFKPGYSIFWRDSRKIVKKTLNLKFQYQKKLTKYILKYRKYVNYNYYFINDFLLINTLISSKILPNFEINWLFLKNGLIFVNGFSTTNPFTQLFKNDYIQLVVSKKYYILFKWLINHSIHLKIRLKHKSKKKMLSFSLEDDKQKNNNFSNWILANKNFFFDVPSFLEVDYFTLSFICLTNIPFLSQLNKDVLLETRYGIINLYNWKYIN